jgi:vacuolar protein-sorting-associated protein 4
LARKSQPSIIFIDEVDSLCSSRGEGENDSARRIKTEFLVQMQGVGKDQTGVLVLGATNTPWELDPAIRRRFEKRLYIPLPDQNARRILFQLSIGPTPNSLTDKNIAILAAQTEGYSGADISVMVKDALYQPVRVAQTATHFKKVPDPTGQQEYLLEACSPGERKSIEMSLYDIKTEQFKPNDVSFQHFQHALENVKPSVGVEDLKRFEDWTQQYGQDG